ncbi:TraR/DksA family transcriptional regulator [Sphingorhabdus sp. IMCC26285]|jgi:DnaK suppressor protein|uniref:TraR/DksA family transcriptional regulator n=1 Tax=Sphingorhabdus profundilacus TaxID=2509718 RepID=A0A6I4M5T9_9SPHN|nr:TraR/DksA family transcriptional regulator [Sphingorhabdus profundilacus]MVZ98008.1 TraR/DksA family transcriptional regulator [Sphingorhabdus profundilacus]
MTVDAEVRSKLIARLAELELRGGRIEAQLTEPMSADSEEQAIEIEDDDMLAAQDALVMQEMAAIRAALGRLDQGQYGKCFSCGEPISAARLESMPTATLCADCM